MKKRITRSFCAGLLLGFISMLLTAFMALLVWYRHIGWSGKPSIPQYQSVLLLLPIQDSLDRLGLLGFGLAVVLKGIVYGSLVFCTSFISDSLLSLKKRSRTQNSAQ
jgi:hypothetical protein